MLLAHISDTHFRSRGEKLYGFIDVNAANADVVSQLNALRERPDAVVVSGDIVNCGRPEEYQVARQILGSLNYPLYLIPGNHDDKAHFLEHLHPLCPQLGNDPQNMRYVVDDFATRLLFIDSSHAGTSKGWLTDGPSAGWKPSCSRAATNRQRSLCTTRRCRWAMRRWILLPAKMATVCWSWWSVFRR